MPNVPVKFIVNGGSGQQVITLYPGGSDDTTVLYTWTLAAPGSVTKTILTAMYDIKVNGANLLANQAINAPNTNPGITLTGTPLVSSPDDSCGCDCGCK